MGETMDKTIRSQKSNKEYFHTLGIIDLAKLLHGFCENGEKCYFCPLFESSCAGVDASVDNWIDWLEKPKEDER